MPFAEFAGHRSVMAVTEPGGRTSYHGGRTPPIASEASVSFLLVLWFALVHGSPDPVRLAIQPLTPRSVDKDDAEMVADVLAAKLMESGKFRVMERSEMSRILSEQGFQKSGACEGQKCAVEVGRILGIEQMVVGAFGKLGDSWVLSARRVDVQTGEIVGQSIRQFEGPLKEVPQALVGVVAADLAGGEIALPVRKVEPPRTIAVPKAFGDVRIRIRPDSGATATWIWLEEGQSKRKLGEAPLDTVLRLRQKVFVSAAEPGLAGPTRQYWLVGPEDDRDTAWKFVAAKFRAAKDPGAEVETGTATGSNPLADGVDWRLYGQERRDAESRRAGGVLVRGLGWTLFTGGLVVGVVSLAMANDTSSTGVYSRSQQSRSSLARTAGGSFVVSAAGLITALIGSNIVAEADRRLGLRGLDLSPLAGRGASGQASGVNLSLAF